MPATTTPRPARSGKDHDHTRRSGARVGLALAAAGLALPLAASAALAAPAPGPGGGATVVRDEYGVPHVYGSSARALFYGNGYAQAQDRLWQADLVRRTATGRLSELLGAGTDGANVSGDVFWRQYTGGAARLGALVGQLDPATRTAVRAFADGFNAQIAAATRAGTLPLEYGAAHAVPAPWTPQDVVAASILSTYTVGTTGFDELHDAEVLADQVHRLGPVGGAQAFSDSHWLDDPSAPTSVPGRPARPPLVPVPAATTGQAAAAGTPALHAASGLQQAGEGALRRLGLGGPGHSNVVLLSGRLTRSGSPLLLGGPQIGYSTPQGFVEVGLHGAGYDATGVALAGTPGVSIGVGHGHAWTVTTGGDDNQDAYVELTDPTGHPGAYSYGGRWLPYACRTETIAVAGAAPRAVPVCESVHGIVLSRSGTSAVAMRDATRDRAPQTLRAFLGLDRASSLRGFVATARGIGSSFNIWYADSAGHIAYQRTGRVPVRSAADNRFLPHPGDGSDEWTGFLPASALPSAVDPAQGWLVNWNNKPADGWDNSADGFWQWGPVHRVQALQRQVAALRPGTATLDTLAQVNRVAGTTAQTPTAEAHSVNVVALLPQLLGHVDARQDPRLPGLLALLRGWDERQLDQDGDGSYDSPALTVYNAWYTAFAQRVVVPVLGKDYAPGARDDDVTSNVVARLLERSPALPLQAAYLHGQPVERAVTASLVAALDELTARYGTPQTGCWLTPQASIDWTSQGAGSVPSTPYMNRGTYNQLVELTPGSVHGLDVVAPGQSGDPRSPHFADQLPLYATWRYKPMHLSRADLTAAPATALVVPD